MMALVPRRLIWNLLAINTLSIAIVVFTIGIAVHWLSTNYFVALLDQKNMPADASRSMFLEAVDRYLLIASAVGFTVSSSMCGWLTFRLMSPISRIIRSAQLISAGDYSQRVTTRGSEEIDRLALAFNEMAAGLQRTERLRKDFIVDVAHELRTPLTNIRGYMEGLRDEVISPEKPIFSSILDETLRLVQLVEELLQLARADVAKSNLKIEAFDLTELIQQVIDRFQFRFAERSLRVVISRKQRVEVTGDVDRIKQVLTNLFENAWRYAPFGGTIEIRVTIDSDRVRVATVNDVEGMLTETDSLFERFHRGESSRSREYGGAGLGLAIVKELIHAHGGRVGCQFDAGKVEIWFELPQGTRSS